VAPAFAASADFAIDKPAGRPCPNLREDFRCGIHAQLRERGFPGCEVFDCFGAGQQLTQVTFEGRTWREDPALAAEQFAVLPVMRQLHELLWYLVEALSLVQDPLLGEVAALQRETERHTGLAPAELAVLDIAGHRRRGGDLLRRVSAEVRSRVPERATDRDGADLIGARLRGARLRGASLRGAYLIAADLRDADLRDADLLGADLRDTDLRGADLTGCLFLTRPQVTAARGDKSTRLPVDVERPAHWA
jgi:hypothetical protein